MNGLMESVLSVVPPNEVPFGVALLRLGLLQLVAAVEASESLSKLHAKDSSPDMSEELELGEYILEKVMRRRNK